MCAVMHSHVANATQFPQASVLELTWRCQHPMPTWRSRFTPNEVDPLFHHVKVGMTVIFQSKGAKVSMADVRRVSDHQGNAQNPPLFEVMDVHTGVISWISGHQVTHVVPVL